MFSGVMTALVTPFRDGVIDEPAFCALLERQIAAGVDAVVVAGTTGEAATLSVAEHKSLIALTVETVAGRLPVIAGTGSNCTADAIELTRFAKDCGADAALLISPYYNKPTQEGIYQHYRAVAEAVHLPMIIYNVPGRTGSNILPETVGRLSHISNIVGLKDATADLAQLTRTMIACQNRIEFYTGDDATIMPFMAVGGVGVISVVSNIIPEQLKQLTNAVESGEWATARALHEKLLPLCDAMFTQTNPIPVKAACAILGWMGWELRLPLTQLPDDQCNALATLMAEFGLPVVQNRP